jgi:signal peptidase I
VKRIIGVPGDRVHLRNGIVYRNGQKLDEPYAQHKVGDYNPYRDNFPAVPPSEMYGVRNERWQQEFRSHLEGDDIVVPPNSYFAMGDNRDVSYDSRYWGFITRQNVIGRPMFIYWPYARLGHRLAWIILPHSGPLANNCCHDIPAVSGTLSRLRSGA